MEWTPVVITTVAVISYFIEPFRWVTWLIIFLWITNLLSKNFYFPSKITALERDGTKFSKKALREIKEMYDNDKNKHFVKIFGEELVRLRENLGEIEVMHAILRERHVHSSKKQRLVIAEDWNTYAHAVQQRTNELLNPRMGDMDDNQWNKMYEERREKAIQREEIEARFKKLMNE